MNSFEMYNLIGGTASLSSLVSREVRNELVTKVGSVSYTDYEAVWSGIEEEMAEKEAVKKSAEVKRAQVRLMKEWIANKAVQASESKPAKLLVAAIVSRFTANRYFAVSILDALKDLSILLEVRIANTAIVGSIKGLFA